MVVIVGTDKPFSIEIDISDQAREWCWKASLDKAGSLAIEERIEALNLAKIDYIGSMVFHERLTMRTVNLIKSLSDSLDRQIVELGLIDDLCGPPLGYTWMNLCVGGAMIRLRH